MPKINPNVNVAVSLERTPGRWLAEVKPTITTKAAGTKPAVEISASKAGFEQWKCAFTIVDEHPQAPAGALVFDRLTWDGDKAESRVYALLRAMGHPVDEWRKVTDPARVREIKPEDLHGRPIVLDCAVNEKGFLETRGFMPFFPATAARGPAPAASPAASPSKPGASASSSGEGCGGLPF